MRATARMVKKQYSEGLGCPPFFFRFIGSNVFPDIGSGGWTEKRNLKKNYKKAWNRKPWYASRQDDIKS